MASSWGGSWGSAWASSWDATSAATGAGTGGRHARRHWNLPRVRYKYIEPVDEEIAALIEPRRMVTVDIEGHAQRMELDRQRRIQKRKRAAIALLVG